MGDSKGVSIKLNHGQTTSEEEKGAKEEYGVGTCECTSDNDKKCIESSWINFSCDLPSFNISMALLLVLIMLIHQNFLTQHKRNFPVKVSIRLLSIKWQS